MASDRQFSSKRDANYRLPESWTQELIEKIQRLPGLDEKTSYLKEVFLDKFVSSDTDEPRVRKSRAIAKWLATEMNNEATNERLLLLSANQGTDNDLAEYNILPRVLFSSFVSKAQEFILSIVGEMPSEDALIGGFSGGASTSRRRTESHPASKFLGQADITKDALPFWESVLDSCEAWGSFRDRINVNVVPGNVMFTVPKNTSIDRCACKEPDLNMFMQRGLGTEIRQGLRRVGIDLNDQSRNRSLARKGSLDGSLATLDLSSASDSVTTEFVRLLMPDIWFTYLYALRCARTLVDGEEHSNEMFSSMGNGFTFELESLLFYVLARTTAYFRGVSGTVSIYGDDIIVPTELATDLMWVLQEFGFSVNETKSFWTGSFRESCGGHFTDGRCITPFYLREPLADLTDLIHIANAVRQWSNMDESGINDPEVYPLWVLLRDRIPRSLWGGREYSSRYQLVSPEQPKKVLKPRRKRKKTGDGGYLHWLCSSRNRKVTSEPIETSFHDEELTFCDLRGVRRDSSVTWLSDYFPQEVSVDAERLPT